MSGSRYLRAIVSENRLFGRRAMPSYCTAHTDVLRAILGAYLDAAAPILIEATCNQVNQFGGYTRMTPRDFRDLVIGLASDLGIHTDRIILGGDHLGPNPWKNEPAAVAMAKASDMVRSYVAAGFTKIHLDASMACADDAVLAEEEMALRAAVLCEVAEKTDGAGELQFVVGSEVPVPGGETEGFDALAVTTPAAVQKTADLHREAFRARRLDVAFAKVIAIVVQPGVDFSNSRILKFDRTNAAELSAAVHQIPGIAFEAHSTDYQPGGALAELVASHFAILKVGPELTFAYREAVVAMAHIEEWLPCQRRSNVLFAIRKTMEKDPRHWRDYTADDNHAAAARMFGLSDRIRYYWPYGEIQEAVRMLRSNIDRAAIDPGLIAQYVRDIDPMGSARGLSHSEAIIQASVSAVVRKYRDACGDGGNARANEFG